MRSLKHVLPLTVLVLASLLTPALVQGGDKKFTIYAFLPWTEHIAADGTVTKLPKLQTYLQQLGIQPIWVIYESRYTSVWDGQPTRQVKITGEQKNSLVVDEEKIKGIALEVLRYTDRPVSFDTEFGNRFHPETVQPGVLEVVRIFKKYNAKNPVGVYAVAPQAAYAWQDINENFLQVLNSQYRAVANAVDFLSPMIYYGYNPDLTSWKQVAKYSLNAAKSYQLNKPIIPYVSFNYADLSEKGEQDTRERLEFLFENGARGCIVWGSSREKSVFDHRLGWSKALADFAALHP